MRPAALVSLALLTSCGIFGPDGPRTHTIRLPFCGEAAVPMTWAAYKPTGGRWLELTAVAGQLAFDARGALTVAYGNANAARVYSATAQELAEAQCELPWGETKVVQGTVRDVPADERFYVSVGPTTVNSTPFALFVPERPLTIVARTEKLLSGTPSRVIVRHNLTPPSGTDIGVFDFSSSDAKTFESASFTVDGDAAAMHYANTFRHASGEQGLISGDASGATLRHYAVPEGSLDADDYHVINVTAFSQVNVRGLLYYYRRARPIALTIGPHPLSPTGVVTSSTPCSRFRVLVPSQPEYSSFVIARFLVNSANVEVGVSRAFLGGRPATWDLEIPDLALPDGSCLLNAGITSWGVMVATQEGRLALYLGGAGRDGEVRRWAQSSWSSSSFARMPPPIP
jgi:hypothetical protein